MNVSLALTIDVHRTEVGRPHELSVELIDEDGTKIGEIRGAFQVSEIPQGLDVHEQLIVPVVLPLPFELKAYGRYSIEVAIDGHHERTLPFRVALPPNQPHPGGPPGAG